MDYIDLQGKKVSNITNQDKLLSFLYTNILGRMLLKPLIQPQVSKLAGRYLSSALSKWLIPKFIERNEIDMDIYEECDYSSFNDFFTRKIKPDCRPVPEDLDVLISPCDCLATVYPIQENTTFSIKNTEYTLRSLLRSPRLAKRFRGGYAYVLRLTVEDYHRYLYSVSGKQSKNYHIDGTFHTVNPIANDYLPIYKENTREYTVIRSKEFGDVLQMEVGALLVGKISNHKQSTVVTRGEEKGFFEYGGSTIVVLTQKGRVTPRSDLLTNSKNGYETKVLQAHPLGILPH
ncbi:phosphatidylserine decarboxylase [Clostridium sp. AF36-4]|jgi:phosphatidylserine decarboxylase|uniref:phosphatidylserine decarboxylase n=1 Tax=Clostridium sp. AF36-4 TaxID=2293015 RepID=UPI000E3F1629|nr:phosphatidylserine decarboxylase [Clostridium sp. AF36-4]RGF57668.1 phosphatidylserine decarboxylase [Clostridium sp. AF36-4]HBD41999.1 phosphatidylserine decarboxylase [Lachnospiraceae bacterium]